MSNITDKSLAPEKSGDRTSQQNTPVSANQVSVGFITPKSITAFIPSNLNLDKLLDKNSPLFKFKKDEAKYLLDLIVKLRRKNDNGLDDFYVTPHSVLMQRRVRNYRKYLDYFVDNGILIEDSQYIVGKKSRGFAYSHQYATEIKQTKITDFKLIKKILNYYLIEKKESIIDNDDSNISYLLKWLEDGKLKIDYEAAKLHLKSLYLTDRNTFVETKEYKKMSKASDFNFQRYRKEVAMQKYNSRLRPLVLFHRATFNAGLDTTVGRLHSVLTQLKSDLRQFITYNNQLLVAIDIVNSQPYLASVLLNSKKFEENNILNTIQLYNPKYHTPQSFPIMLAKLIEKAMDKDNVQKYIDAVKSGQFYEEFGKQLGGNLNRKSIKKATFSSIFSPNQLAPHIDGIQLFKKTYPDVYKIFSKIKYGKGTHGTLACTLQHFEAQLILHTACKKISNFNSDIPLFTIHDSIVTIPQYQTIVGQIMEETLENAIGFKPSLKTEKWERVA